MHPIDHLRRNAVAYLALFVALGGTSYAAVKLPAASVGARELKANAVTARTVKDGSLLARDFKTGQLPAGPQGPQGPQGPKGDPGTVDTSQFFDKGASDARYAQKCGLGTVTGAVWVNATSGFPNTPTPTDVIGWNCTGLPVTVKRRAVGEYMVVFEGQNDFLPLAVGNADFRMPATGYAQVSEALPIGNNKPDGWPVGTFGFLVGVRDGGGTPVDEPFELMVTRRM